MKRCIKCGSCCRWRRTSTERGYCSHMERHTNQNYYCEFYHMNMKYFASGWEGCSTWNTFKDAARHAHGTSQ